jgi:DNA-binding transcriptional MerR regulator
VPDELLTIGELARRTSRRTSSIRYYEQIGLLPEPVRVGGRRRYREQTVRTLTVVDTAQRAGLALSEIRTLLTAAPGESAAIEELRGIAERKLPELEATIERAVLVRRWLEAAARCECPSLDECCLFEPEAGLPERQPAEIRSNGQ